MTLQQDNVGLNYWVRNYVVDGHLVGPAGMQRR